MNDQKVLIVGGGPVGLVLALRLSKAGIPFRIIERKQSPDRLSKALSLNPSTLEELHHLGLVERVLSSAHLNQDIHIHWKSRMLHTVTLAQVDSPYPFFAMIPQYETEAILREALNETGHPVSLGVTLARLSETSDGVVATLRDAKGRATQERYDFVVGADGARSTVRQLANIPFSGGDYGMHFAMIDAEISCPSYENRWHYFVTEDRFAVLIPMQGGLHRLVIQGNGPFDPTSKYQQEDFPPLLASMALHDLKIGPAQWISAAPIYHRLASTFRKGSIILAGDAAHLFSPIGGQGLNTGVQDAADLAEALNAHIKNGQPSTVLDDFAINRRGFAKRMGDFCDKLTNVIARVDTNPRGPARDFLPRASQGPFLSHDLPQALAGRL